MIEKLINSSSGLLKTNKITHFRITKTPLVPPMWSGVFFISPLVSGCDTNTEDKVFLLALVAISGSFLFSSLCLCVVYRLLKYQIKKNHLNHYLFTENAYGKHSCGKHKQDGDEEPEDEANNDVNTLRSTSQRINQNRRTVIDVSGTKPKPQGDE